MKEKMREFVKGRAAALLTVGVAVLVIAAGVMILHGCMGWGKEDFSGGDSDSLSVVPAADAAMGVAENGKLYDYFWRGEMDEQQLEEQCEKEWQKILAEYQEMDADQETIENRRKEFDGEIDWMKKELEKARLLDPAVSAQEAANTAGMLFEDAYGLDPEENTLFLDCVENPDSRGVKRLEWLIQTGRQNPSEEGMGFCAVDATTGKVISCSYLPSGWETENCVSEELLPVVRTYSEEGRQLYAYDPSHPQWPEFAEEKRAQIQAFLRQAGLDKNRTVERIQAEENELNGFRFTVSFADGGKAEIQFSLRPWCVSDWGEYPGKGMEYHTL